MGRHVVVTDVALKKKDTLLEGATQTLSEGSTPPSLLLPLLLKGAFDSQLRPELCFFFHVFPKAGKLFEKVQPPKLLSVKGLLSPAAVSGPFPASGGTNGVFLLFPAAAAAAAG